MVTVGETVLVPESLPSVKALVPVHEAALIEERVREEGCPAVIFVGEAVRVTVGRVVLELTHCVPFQV